MKKNILVTGGASGIGAETCRLFAKKGWRVLIADIDMIRGNAISDQIRADGGESEYHYVDVSDCSSVAKLFESAYLKHYIDCAFNNAGIKPTKKMTEEFEENDFDTIYRVDLKGVWLCMKEELRRMSVKGNGVIINNASICGLIPWLGLSPYVAFKHAVVGLTKTAALEYAQKGIRINAVCPGDIDTPMNADESPTDAKRIASIPVGRVGNAADIAHAVYYLCSEEASFVHGHCLVVDGGYTIKAI